jgi:hypothetical protein
MSELRERLEEMFAGRLCAADAEQMVMDGFEKYVKLFHEGDRSDSTMRRLRVYNEARANKNDMRKEADAIAYALSFIPKPNKE